jgi:hypothetical protein
VAVGPLVVAGRVDERIGEEIEIGADLFEVAGRALARAVLDVAEMDDQLNLGSALISATSSGKFSSCGWPYGVSPITA